MLAAAYARAYTRVIVLYTLTRAVTQRLASQHPRHRRRTLREAAALYAPCIAAGHFAPNTAQALVTLGTAYGIPHHVATAIVRNALIPYC